MIRKKFKKKEIAIAIISAVIVTFILSFYIWHQTELIRLGYKAGELESQAQQLRREIQKLETIKARYLSLERVEKIAREELNMKPAREDQIIYHDFGQKQ